MMRGNYERDARSGLLLPRGLRRLGHPQFFTCGPGFFGGSATPGDPNFANVSLLLHMDGTNGSTTFTDNSSSPKTVTATNATISTAQSKFGGASGLFNGTSAYLSAAYAAGLNLVGVDFTLETWVYLVGYAGSGNSQLINKDATNTAYPSYALSISPSGKLNTVLGDSSGQVNIQTATGTNTVPLTTWTHVAMTRSGTTVRGFVGGTLDSTFTQSVTMVDSGRVVTIANSGSLISTDYLNGYLDDLRITKGVARYTASFTPPTAAFPNHG